MGIRKATYVRHVVILIATPVYHIPCVGASLHGPYTPLKPYMLPYISIYTYSHMCIYLYTYIYMSCSKGVCKEGTSANTLPQRGIPTKQGSYIMAMLGNGYHKTKSSTLLTVRLLSAEAGARHSDHRGVPGACHVGLHGQGWL